MDKGDGAVMREAGRYTHTQVGRKQVLNILACFGGGCRTQPPKYSGRWLHGSSSVGLWVSHTSRVHIHKRTYDVVCYDNVGYVCFSGTTILSNVYIFFLLSSLVHSARHWSISEEKITQHLCDPSSAQT